MTNKQARLVSAITDAMEAQGLSQANLARIAGMSQGGVSLAMSGKTNCREEKWRIMCEALALDYDEVVKDEEMPAEACEGVDDEEAADEESQSADNVHTAPARHTKVEKTGEPSPNEVCAKYLKAKLQEDIRKGTEMPLVEIYILLDHVMRLKGEEAE